MMYLITVGVIWLALLITLILVPESAKPGVALAFALISSVLLSGIIVEKYNGHR